MRLCRTFNLIVISFNSLNISEWERVCGYLSLLCRKGKKNGLVAVPFAYRETVKAFK